MVNIKNTRSKKPSSLRWLTRQMKDPFVKWAQKSGYRSRSAYKLIEINEQYKFLLPGRKIVDLGSSPGGWSQVAANFVGSSGGVIAVDVIHMLPIPGVVFLNKSIEDCIGNFSEMNVDVVISDMAPGASGNNQLDHMRSINLCMLALEFAKFFLKSDGTLLLKVLQGGTEQELYNELKKCFSRVKYVKPRASRKKSAEIYVIGQGFFKNFSQF